MAELVDAQDLGSCGETRESSSLSFRTIREDGAPGRADSAGFLFLRAVTRRVSGATDASFP